MDDSDTLDQANSASFENFDEGEAGGVVAECPRTRGQVLMDNAKKKLATAKQRLSDFRASVKEKLKNLFSEDERAGLESMKNNFGVFPIFNAHGMAVDAIFYRVNKVFGWDKKEPEPGGEADAGANAGQ